MSKVSLNIGCADFPNCPVWIGDGQTESSTEKNQIVRSSPIYPVEPKASAPSLISGEKLIWFGFTIDPFKCIAKIKRDAPQFVPDLYTSHGIASLILFFRSDNDAKQIHDLVKESLVGEETWHIKDGRIIATNHRVAKCPKFVAPDLDLPKHGSEDYSIFRDVRNSIGMVGPQLARLSKEHEEMLSSITFLAQQLSANLLFLQEKITEEEYKRRYLEFFSEEIVSRAVEQIKFEKAERQRTTIALHQFRDEAIQLAAILQSIFQQGLAGVPPILNSPYQAGTFSLLGIGGVFAALLALYSRVRKVFVTVQPDRIISEGFPNWKAPEFPADPTKYEQWRNTLKDYSQQKNSPPEYSLVPSFFHLLYFSNRLGFRATKLSITAAYQSICLGMMPSWNVSTIFHEFLHAHVKAIFAELYPLEESTFKNAYRLYTNRLSEPNRAKHLTPFIRLFILDVVSSLYRTNGEGGGKMENLPIARCLPENSLREGLGRYHDQIDELFVHVLDLNYFYQSDTDTYILSIWSSWLTLPFITKRLMEYALRTLCAIASIDDGNRMDRFNRAINNLKKQLQKLGQYDFVDQALLRHVIDFLDKESTINTLRYKFFPLVALADVVAEFFVIPTVQPQLFREVADVLQKDESYSYEFKIGDYKIEGIESPVKFLMDQLKHALARRDAFTRESGEFATLWSFQAIASTLTLKPYEHQQKN